MFLFDTGRDRPRWIVHFPTKRHWRDRSAIGDIEAGLRGFAATIPGHGIRSVAIPPIGCGLGGLDWRAVRPLITACLADMPGTVIVLEPAPEAEPCAGAGVRLREEREAMTRDTTSIFASGAVIVPDIVIQAEERRILLRVSQAPWMTDLSRRVQHYGYRYNYRGPTRQLAAIFERRLADIEGSAAEPEGWVFPSSKSGTGYVAGVGHFHNGISEAGGAKFWFHGLRNAFITVAERELMLPRSLTKRLVNHARPSDVTEGYAADWTVEQLREPAQRMADRIDVLMNSTKTGDLPGSV